MANLKDNKKNSSNQPAKTIKVLRHTRGFLSTLAEYGESYFDGLLEESKVNNALNRYQRALDYHERKQSLYDAAAEYKQDEESPQQTLDRLRTEMLNEIF